ncbi:MAG: YesL family protein, partial [Brachybacterium sp.]|nr:YesL family protein [Brachybacterium sp.]
RREGPGMSGAASSFAPRPRRHTTWLVEGIGHLYAVVRVQLMWLLLTALGLVVFGISPATCAAADALRAERRGELTRALPLMWESYRRELIPAGLRMLPLMAVQLLALAMLWQAAAGLGSAPVSMAVLGTRGALAAGWATVSLAAIAVAPRVRRQKLLVTWRLALLMPGVVPLRGLALILLLAAWILLCTTVWPLGAVLGAGLAVDAAVALLGTRISLLLEDLGGHDPASAPSRTTTP